jgi:hypothetical protein
MPRSPCAREFTGVINLQSNVELQVGGGLAGDESGQLLCHAAAGCSLFTFARRPSPAPAVGNTRPVAFYDR